MRKFLVVIVFFLSMAIATNSWAALINSGSLTVENGGLAISGWASPLQYTVTWDVNSNVNNTWTYHYAFSVSTSSPKPVLSFIDLEVLSGFSIIPNLISDMVAPYAVSATGPTTYNSGTTNSIYGLQWDFANYELKHNNTLNLTLTTNTKPMWGDIYIGGETADYYAKNSGYGPSLNNPNAITGSGTWTVGSNTYGSVLVPTPIPGAVWLLGAGLIGLIGIRRRFVS